MSLKIKIKPLIQQPLPSSSTAVFNLLKSDMDNGPGDQPVNMFIQQYVDPLNRKPLSTLVQEIVKDLEQLSLVANNKRTHRDAIDEALEDSEENIPRKRYNEDSPLKLPPIEDAAINATEDFFSYEDSPKVIKEVIKGLISDDIHRENNYRKDAREVRLQTQPLQPPALEPVTMSYCADFLRPAVYPGERPCKKGEKCIVKVMAVAFPDTIKNSIQREGFICREWLLPSELNRLKEKNGKPPAFPKCCLMCTRLLVHFRILQVLRKRVSPKEVLADHATVIEPNGYQMYECLSPVSIDNKWLGLSEPYRKFTRNLLYDKMKLGEKTVPCLVELRMGPTKVE